MRLLLALACLPWASPVWAAPLPDYEACTFSIAAINLYQQTTPTGPAVKVSTIVLPGGPYITLCPTEQGTYYYSARLVGSDGVEGMPNGAVFAFTIKGGAPPLVFAIGGRATVTTQLLNVRPTPTSTNSPCGVPTKPACPTVAKGAIGTILDGPIAADSLTWWRIDWGGGKVGWSADKFLVPTP